MTGDHVCSTTSIHDIQSQNKEIKNQNHNSEKSKRSNNPKSSLVIGSILSESAHAFVITHILKQMNQIIS